MANAPICHRKTPFAPIISPTAEQSRAAAICQGDTHNAEINKDVTGNATLYGIPVWLK